MTLRQALSPEPGTLSRPFWRNHTRPCISREKRLGSTCVASHWIEYRRSSTSGCTDAGMFGSLTKRHHPLDGTETAMLGFECTVAVASVEDTSKKVVAAGGKIVMPKVTINGVGHLIKFNDTEGNLLGAMHYDEHAS